MRQGHRGQASLWEGLRAGCWESSGRLRGGHCSEGFGFDLVHCTNPRARKEGDKAFGDSSWGQGEVLPGRGEKEPQSTNLEML